MSVLVPDGIAQWPKVITRERAWRMFGAPRGGYRSANTSQEGAFHTVASQPLGAVLLWIIALGLLDYALWQLIAAFQADDQDTSKE